jgi:hypothetical protein
VSPCSPDSDPAKDVLAGIVTLPHPPLTGPLCDRLRVARQTRPRSRPQPAGLDVDRVADTPAAPPAMASYAPPLLTSRGA